MVFIQTHFFLYVMLQSADDVRLLHLLSHCPHVPHQVLPEHHAADSVLVFCVENFLVFDLVLYLAIFSEGVGEDTFDVFSKLFAGAGHFGVFDVVGDDNFLGFAQLGDFYWLDGWALVGSDHHVPLSHREVAWFGVEDLEVDAHFAEEGDEAQADAFEGG